MSMFKKCITGVGLAAVAALTLTPAQARETHNWMRDYVELRLQAQLARAVGAEAAAQAAADARARIIGGSVAQSGSNPFQVGLLFKAEPDNYFAQFCGGTLFKRIYVITAAHCSDFVGAGDVQVLTNTRKLDGSGVRRDVVSIRIHPNWNPNTFDSDVAIWKLSSQGPIHEVSLAREDPPVGKLQLATGWGNTSTSGSSFPVDLMQVKVPIFSRSSCNDGNSYNGMITGRMLCAGFEAGGKDTCQGDSGGPLTHDPAGGARRYNRLTGITSWGFFCAEPSFPGVYTRVSNRSIRSFIVNNTP